MLEAEGIPPTASVASVGKSLRYLGEHCYAYSGLYAASQTAQTVLDFTTGAGYIVATFQLNGNVDDDSGGFVGAFSVISFNEITIAVIKTASSAEDSPTTVAIPLVVPPFTRLQASIDSSTDSADAWGSLIFTGRVYDA